MYVKSGATAGWVHPYFDYIAIVKWLNQTFGYHITVPEFLAEDSPWGEWELDMHLYYADTFNDERLMRAANQKRVRDRLERKSYFCISYELLSKKQS